MSPGAEAPRAPRAAGAEGEPGEAWIPLAEVARPHGVKGELRLRLFNRDSDVLLEQEEVLLRFPDGEEQEVSVDGARRADDAILMRLHAVADRDKADELRGALVCVKREAFPSLEAGEFYVCDLEGARVEMRRGEALEPLGVVKELRTYPSVDVLVVQADDAGKDWEIPLVAAFVEEVDPARRLVIVSSLDELPRG